MLMEPQHSGANESMKALQPSFGQDSETRSGSLSNTHLAFVLPYYGVGGAEKQLANLIAHRPDYARNVKVSTITFQPPASDYVRGRFEANGVTSTLIDRSRMPFPLFFLRLLWAIVRTRPTIVSTFLGGSTGTWGRLAAIMAFVPTIVHSDRSVGAGVQPVHTRLRSFLDRHTARFLPNAHAIADELVADGVPVEKIRVMWNGVDLSVFTTKGSAMTQPSWRSESSGTVLGYLGRFHPTKRVDLLLEAIKQLDVSQRPGLLVLAGDGVEMPRIRGIIEADPWLRDHCRLLGTIDDTVSFLDGIDYLVLPSESEGLPNVVLEAMAMSKPVISTKVSDIPMLVGDAGLVVDAGNLEQLTNALLTIQTLSSEERVSLGRKARERVEQNFSIEVASKRFWDAHLELLSPIRSGS